MRRFARLELQDGRIPDDSTILRFRHLLEWYHLTQALFEAACLQQAGELDGISQYVSAALVVDGVMSTSLRLKNAKVVKKHQKRGHSSLK